MNAQGYAMCIVYFSHLAPSLTSGFQCVWMSTVEPMFFFLYLIFLRYDFLNYVYQAFVIDQKQQYSLLIVANWFRFNSMRIFLMLHFSHVLIYSQQIH